MNMGSVFMERLKDFTKTEEMYRLALYGYKKSLGKEDMTTKNCAYNNNNK